MVKKISLFLAIALIGFVVVNCGGGSVKEEPKKEVTKEKKGPAYEVISASTTINGEFHAPGWLIKYLETGETDWKADPIVFVVESYNANKLLAEQEATANALGKIAETISAKFVKEFAKAVIQEGVETTDAQVSTTFGEAFKVKGDVSGAAENGSYWEQRAYKEDVADANLAGKTVYYIWKKYSISKSDYQKIKNGILDNAKKKLQEEKNAELKAKQEKALAELDKE